MEPSTQQTPMIPQAPAKPPKREGLKSILSTIAILVAAPLVAIFLTAFVFQSYEVDGQSMEATLHDNDRLIVLKTGKTWASIFNQEYIPARGEIIVFNMDSSAGVENGRQLIKRVVGLPGDRVVIKSGRITVYNNEFPEGFNPDKNEAFRNQISPTTRGTMDVTVPEGEVFVCGDNRSNSLDSRSFGTIPSEDIVGTLALRIYPFSKFETF